jgi:hypothetical protein
MFNRESIVQKCRTSILLTTLVALEKISNIDSTNQEHFEDMSMDDDEDVIEDGSEDDDSSIVDYLVFDNKLAYFILRHDWQNIGLNLQTEEGR